MDGGLAAATCYQRRILFGVIVIVAFATTILPCTATAPASTQSTPTSTWSDFTIDVIVNGDASILEWNGVRYHRQPSMISSLSSPIASNPSPLPIHVQTSHDDEPSEWMSPNTSEFWMYSGIVLVLVTLAGTMSGLTVGLLSVSPLEISILRGDPASDPAKRRYAEKLSGLIAPERHHLLLVTLLLINAACMESVPLFLDRLVPSAVAILLSVSFVLIFGEILPQALCSANPLKIGANLSPLVWAFICITFPISWPIAKLLDKVLGHEGGKHFLSGRSQMTALLALQEEAEVLQSNETKIMRAVMGLKSKKVADEMTTFDKCFSMSTNDTLDRSKLRAVLNAGHSRVPLYRGHKHNIRSILLTKSLIVVNPDKKLSVAELPAAFLRPPIWVSPDAELLPLLDELLCGKLHLALVTRQLAEVHEALSSNSDIPSSVEVLGFITLADIVEAMLDAEILDEFDPEAHLPVPGTGATDVDRSPALGPMAPTGTPSPKLEAMSAGSLGMSIGAGSVRLAKPSNLLISSPRNRNRTTRTWTKPNASGLATTSTTAGTTDSTTTGAAPSSTTGPPSLLLSSQGTSTSNLRLETKRPSDADEDHAWGDASARSVDGGGGAGPIGSTRTIVPAGTPSDRPITGDVTGSPRVAGRFQRDLSTVRDHDDEFEAADGEAELPPPSVRSTGRLFGGLLSGIAVLGERRHQRMGSQAKLFSPTPSSYVPSGAVAVGFNTNYNSVQPPTPSARSVAITNRTAAGAPTHAAGYGVGSTNTSHGTILGDMAVPRSNTSTATASTPLLKSIQ